MKYLLYIALSVQMHITSQKFLTKEQTESIWQLWNAEYPLRLKYDHIGEFTSYLDKLENKSHFLLTNDKGSLQGWCATFKRDNEKWFVIILNSSIQGKNFGTLMLNEIKKQENHLVGWVIDNEAEVKPDGIPYRSPLPFYQKRGFLVHRDIRIETERLSAVKIEWAASTDLNPRSNSGNVLQIVYQDANLVAINKPHGLLVHRSAIANDATEFALQMLRKQLNRHVYPAHRLDRKTGGVLLFALSKDVERLLQQQFRQNLVDKKYLSIVRGYTDEAGEIDYPLRKENGTLQEAFTKYKTIARAELAVPFGLHATSRYSLVEANPSTGRMHQLRKHFSHIFHPIIGDRTHGCNKQNKLFTDQWQMDTMLLHALQLSFIHPVTQIAVCINAPLQEEFLRMMELMGWNNY